MLNTLTFPDIIKELSALCKCTEAEARVFVSAFCEEITSGVISDGMVRIKGLGTFRSLETADGKTVGFFPERKVADQVNAPFAMFEPVELSGDIDEEQFVAEFSETTEHPSTDTNDNGKSSIEDAHADMEDRNVSEALTSNADAPLGTAEDNSGNQSIPAAEPIVSDNLDDATPSAVESSDDKTLPDGIPPVPGESNKEQVACNTEEADVTVSSEDSSSPEVISDVRSEEADTQHLPRIEENVSQPVSEDRENEASLHCSDYRNEYSHLPLRDVDDGFVVPRESEKDVKIIEHRPRWGTLAIVFAIALALGVLIGYFGFPWINLHEVKNVKITADNVCVTHQPVSREVIVEEVDSLAENTDSTVTGKVKSETSSEKLAPVKENEKAIASSQLKAKIVTDTVQGNNYLSRIARRHYGKDVFWVYIYEENIDKIQDPDNIPAGTVVVIPPPEKYNIDANNPESVKAAERKRYVILTGN